MALRRRPEARQRGLELPPVRRRAGRARAAAGHVPMPAIAEGVAQVVGPVVAVPGERPFRALAHGGAMTAVTAALPVERAPAVRAGKRAGGGHRVAARYRAPGAGAGRAGALLEGHVVDRAAGRPAQLGGRGARRPGALLAEGR